jgi:Tfp pilus assembly protein PilF
MTRRVPHRFAIDRWTGRAALALALAFATSAELAAAPDAGEAVEPPSDAMADFRLEEAILAMGRGEFERALDLSLLVVMQDPKDARAHREAGRAAHALGRFQIAIDHLERALALQGDQPDPEARYLLGEAYYATGRTRHAIRHHDRTRREVRSDTSNWMELLWLARIHARRDELGEAERIYRGLLRRDPSSVEVQISRIEAYTLAGRWAEAEKLVREFIAGHPDHERAPEMLAWILGAQDKTLEERKLRERLAADPDREGPRLLVDHARALERGGDYRAAISRYEEALSRVDPDSGEVDEVGVRAAVTRLRLQLTPETTVGAGLFSDPSGSIQRLRAGVGLPVADQVTLAPVASMEWAGSGATPGAMATPGVRVGTLDLSVVAGHAALVAGALTVSTSHFSFDDGDTSTRLGTAFDVRVGQGKPLQLHTTGTISMPWRETAGTMREGGRETGITSTAYALPFGPRVIFDAGVRLRSLSLDPVDEMEDATGSQKMLIGGADWVVWAPSTRAGRGQFLDDDLRWGTAYLADSVTLSYRHYEAFIEDDFGGRLDLSERSTIDEISTVARNSWPDGSFAIEARAGGGRDWARDTRLWRVGSSLLAIPFERFRGSISYDYANESTSGFTGSRHTAWASIHLEL